MAFGACVAYLALSATSVPQNDSAIQFWLNQPKDEYNWNVTEVLQWTSVNLFINLAVSPLGELYGIQKYDDNKNIYQFIYKFDFDTGRWSLYDNTFMCQDIFFDKMGRMYLLDTTGNVFGPNSRINMVLSGVQYVAATVDGRLYAISNTTTASPNAWVDGTWDI